MKREILFRGKRIDNGEWVYGYFYEECGATYIIEDRQKETMLNRNTPNVIIPETIGQFTGLTDKNGVKVFEADVLSSKSPYRYYVKYKDTAFYVYHCEIKDVDKTPYRWGLLSRFNELGIEVEVIGNIHDNPELLKEQ